MLQHAFDSIAARNDIIDECKEICEICRTMPYDIIVLDYYNTSTVLYNFVNEFHYVLGCLYFRLNTVMRLLNKENRRFKELLLTQIRQNTRHRLLARLCSKSIVWDQIMLKEFVNTTTFPLSQYQKHADDIDKHTTFIQINCRILVNYYDQSQTLTNHSRTNDINMINSVQSMLINAKQVLDSATAQCSEQDDLCDLLKSMIRQLNN